MRTDELEIHSVILAEDIRQEASGLQTLVGVLPSRLIVAAKPLVMRSLHCRIDYTTRRKVLGTHSMEITTPSGETLTKGDFEFSVEANIDGIASCSWAPVNFPVGGVYVFRFGLKDSKLENIYSFGLTFLDQ